MTLALARHHATSRHAGSIYPWQAQASLPTEGCLIGPDYFSGGAFSFDPWHLYSLRPPIITDPNILFAGEVGSGKSATVKVYLARQVGAFGRWCAVVDPKGEYRLLAAHLGLTVVKLMPGGTERLNPLDTAGANPDPDALRRRRTEVLAHLIAASTERRLSGEEQAAISAACYHLAADATLADVVELLLHPTLGMAAAASTTQAKMADACREAALELRRLVTGDLAGMFDGHTTTTVDWRNGRGVVFDVSEVFTHPSLPMVMLLILSWLSAALTQPGGPKRIIVLDEAWAVLKDLNTVRWLQASYKLSRGSDVRASVSNVAVVHRLADLRAQSDDGTTAAKVAEGLLADTATRVIFAQKEDQIANAQQLLGLGEAEARYLSQLPRGRALWRVGRHPAIVDTYLHPDEVPFTYTDARMA